MPEQVWRCTWCKTTYDAEDYADACEAAHRHAHTFVVTQATYQVPEQGSHLQREHARRVPHRILVKFSEEHGDFASYELDHYGYKGV